MYKQTFYYHNGTLESFVTTDEKPVTTMGQFQVYKVPTTLGTPDVYIPFTSVLKVTVEKI